MALFGTRVNQTALLNSRVQQDGLCTAKRVIKSFAWKTTTLFLVNTLSMIVLQEKSMDFHISAWYFSFVYNLHKGIQASAGREARMLSALRRPAASTPSPHWGGLHSVSGTFSYNTMLSLLKMAWCSLSFSVKVLTFIL